jgi:hypothetical protein
VLITVAKRECGGAGCPQELAMKISIHADRNLRRALLMLEAAKVQSPTGTLTNDLPVQLPVGLQRKRIVYCH